MDENNKLFPKRLNFMVNEEMFNTLNLIRRELDYKNMSVLLRHVINEGLIKMEHPTSGITTYRNSWEYTPKLDIPMNIIIGERDAGLKQFNKEHKEE